MTYSRRLNYRAQNYQKMQHPSKKTIFMTTSQELSCDGCQSKDILATSEGYVCRTCGLVSNEKIMQYHRPYEEGRIQYAPLGTTQIGSSRERYSNKHSIRLNHLNKLQNLRENSKSLETQAKMEIKRIFEALKIPANFKAIVFEKYQKIRKELKPGTKYRSYEKLIPIVIYYVLKKNSVVISQLRLLEVSKITKKDFNSFKLQMSNFIPNYVNRDRQSYIKQRILQVSEEFQLGMQFFHECSELLISLWEGVKNTKDNVVAGVICSINVLCSNKYNISVNQICDILGIRMSTIQSQVEKRFIKRYRVKGFKSLVKSAELLKKLLIYKGFLNCSDEISVRAIRINKDEKVPKVIHIKLSGDVSIFNPLRQKGALRKQSEVSRSKTNSMEILIFSDYQDHLSSYFILPRNNYLDDKVLQHYLDGNNLKKMLFSGKGPP